MSHTIRKKHSLCFHERRNLGLRENKNALGNDVERYWQAVILWIALQPARSLGQRGSWFVIPGLRSRIRFLVESILVTC